jgi:hypothetical protein
VVYYEKRGSILSKIGQIQTLVGSGLYYLTEHADDEAIEDGFDLYDVECGIIKMAKFVELGQKKANMK